MRPRVLLITWLFAKDRNVQKYVDLFQSMGCETHTLRPGIMDILRPNTVAARHATEKHALLAQDAAVPTIICTFSMGAYMFSQFLSVSERTASKINIVGQIFDSPVDWHGVPFGVAASVSRSPLVRSLVKNTLWGAFFLLSPVLTRHLRAASATFRDKAPDVPTLIITSEDDPVSPVKPILDVIDTWKLRFASPVDLVLLPKSRHVAHILDHPERYHDELGAFVNNLSE